MTVKPVLELRTKGDTHPTSYCSHPLWNKHAQWITLIKKFKLFKSLFKLFHELQNDSSLSSFGALNAKLQSVKHVAVSLGHLMYIDVVKNNILKE